MEWAFPALARQLKLKQQKSVISSAPLCWILKSWTARTLLVTSCLRIPICSTDHQMHGAICPFWLAETRENALPAHRDKFSGHRTRCRHPWTPPPFSCSLAPRAHSLPTTSTCASFLGASFPLSEPKCVSLGGSYPGVTPGAHHKTLLLSNLEETTRGCAPLPRTWFQATLISPFQVTLPKKCSLPGDTS